MTHLSNCHYYYCYYEDEKIYKRHFFNYSSGWQNRICLTPKVEPTGPARKVQVLSHI